MLDDLQKRTAQAIVNVFETGSVRGDYGQVTILPGDTGHLTYGRAQTTLSSGNLFLLIKAYVEAPGSQFGPGLRGFLEDLEARDTSLDTNAALNGLLRRAGDDPLMHEVQDSFFDRVYWAPALGSAQRVGVTEPLGVGVIYDSRIHGSWGRMRDRTIASHGTVEEGGEREWIANYVETRRDWLAHHSNALLRRTVYRMDAFGKLIDDGAWSLPLPLAVRGVTIDEVDLADPAPIRVSAEEDFTRMLRIRDPFMRGDDVREVQDRLIARGLEIEADGVFGHQTDRAVRAFQQAQGLVADGIVGQATRSALERPEPGRALGASG